MYDDDRVGGTSRRCTRRVCLPSGTSDCLFLIPRSFKRFAVTREIDDGMLAPRFAPSTRGWALSGDIVAAFPSLGTSVSEDSDDR